MSARATMAELIETLRGMTDAGTADYTIGTAAYWDGDHIQTVLDRHRVDVYFEPLQPVEKYTSGGSVEFHTYYSVYKNYEQTSGGTAIFWLEDGTGADVGTVNYTVDYLNGRITFTADTEGTVYYLTGRSYDLNAAAADVWRQKASHYATRAVDFSTDNHRFSQSQIIRHCQDMATYYASMGAPVVVTLERSDLNVHPE